MRHALSQRRGSFIPINRPSAWLPVQPKPTAGAGADWRKVEADHAADAVMNKALARIGTMGPALVQRDSSRTSIQRANAGEAQGKRGGAFLKTAIGKQLVEAAERLGKDFVATLPGKTVAGAAAIATIAELGREHKGLPMQPPVVPLDFVAPGLKAQLRIEGPIEHSSAASICFASPSAIDARACTYGDHLVFGRGRFGLTRRNGQWLLAHELAHAAQQAEAVNFDIVPRVRRKRDDKEQPHATPVPAPDAQMTDQQRFLSLAPDNRRQHERL